MYLEGKKTLPETYVFTLGNPLVAQTFVQYDTRAGMYVPPRVLVNETEEGGTEVVYDLPSSLILAEAGLPAEMQAAVLALDEKLEKMLTRVISSK